MSTTIPQSSSTQKFSKTMGGSMKSLFSPDGRTYFRLEHKTNSEKHKLGESANFLTDYVELGRGDKYAVNFGDDCKSVSRPHASISRNANGWLLAPISQTNATLLNNKPIVTATLLTNGDEIQLAASGPKVSFLIPNDPSVKSLGFTNRMKSVMNEAIRPYKKTVAIMSVAFIAIIAGLSAIGMARLDKAEEEVEYQNKLISSLTKKHLELIQAYSSQSQKIVEFQNQQEKFRRELKEKINVNSSNPYKALYNYIYYIKSYKVEYTYGGETKEIAFGISGTGFLLNDGKFVTARHVAEPWYYPTSEDDTLSILLNKLITSGEKVKLYFNAYSPSGDVIKLTSDNFTFNKSDLKLSTKKTSLGEMDLTLPKSDNMDWATADYGGNKGLEFDRNLSNSLVPNTQLTVLGYPRGIGARSNDIKPVNSTCTVSMEGLENGMLVVSGISYDHGSSGGPIFADVNGKLTVVAIVSSMIKNNGFVVPISSIQ